MGLLRAGIRKLSELDIDADKDWNRKGITNLKELAQAMAKGDLVVRGDNILVKLPPRTFGYVLTSAGPLHIPSWCPAGGEFKYYFPVTIELSHALAIVAVDKFYNKNAPITTWNRQTYGDAPADYIKRLTPAIALVDAGAVVTPDKTHNKDAPISSAATWKKVVDGAVAEDGGVQTDETSAAQDATLNDMHLLPTCTNGGLVVGDVYYFGFAYKFDRLWLNVSTAGVGNYALAHEYWDGVASDWLALPDVVDETSEFTIAGTNKIDFTRPGDWALTTIQGHNLYWIRARVAAVVSYATQPLGAQAWCEIFI